MKRYIRRSPTKDPFCFHSLNITTLKKVHINWWNENVQPTINQDQTRVDQGWRWTRIRALCRLAGVRQSVKEFAILLSTHKNDAPVVLGICIVARRYPHLVNPKFFSTYLWYCTTIPRPLLQTHVPKTPIPTLLGRITMDVAVTAAFNMGWGGRTSCHADAKGGSNLLDFYVKTCGMTRLTNSYSLPTLFRNIVCENDGRYVFFDEVSAKRFSNDLTHLRKSD